MLGKFAWKVRVILSYNILLNSVGEMIPYGLKQFGFAFTQCSTGGRCLSVEYTDRVGELAKKHGLKLHIDGARIFNASMVSKTFVSFKFRLPLAVGWFGLTSIHFSSI